MSEAFASNFHFDFNKQSAITQVNEKINLYLDGELKNQEKIQFENLLRAYPETQNYLQVKILERQRLVDSIPRKLINEEIYQNIKGEVEEFYKKFAKPKKETNRIKEFFLKLVNR